MIKKEDKPEFIGQILDLFEDFLDEYGIKIPQKEGEEGYDPDTPVNTVIFSFGIRKDTCFKLF